MRLRNPERYRAQSHEAPRLYLSTHPAGRPSQQRMISMEVPAKPLTLNASAGETTVVTLPDTTTASRRVMWSDDPDGAKLPVHDLPHIHRLLAGAEEQYSLYFYIEGEAPDSPFVQVARDREWYMVEVKAQLTNWPSVLSQGGDAEIFLMHAPWNTADSIPVRGRQILDRTLAGFSAWWWITRQELLSGITLDDCIRGAHRRSS